MREIKFRAWDSLDKGFVNGGYCRYISMQDSIVSLDSTISNSLIWCQYTGLKDKNGVEIYEGDIVKNEVYIEGYKHVEYHNGSFGYKILIDDSFVWYAFCENTYFLSDIEVIGNIYENPELLELK